MTRLCPDTVRNLADRVDQTNQWDADPVIQFTTEEAVCCDPRPTFARPTPGDDYTPMNVILQRVADWHGQQAAKAYRKRDKAAYIRHARIADKLWGRA